MAKRGPLSDRASSEHRAAYLSSETHLSSQKTRVITRKRSLRIFLRTSCRFSTNMSIHLSTPEDYKTLLDKFDTWLFDCDGVLWRGDELIDGVVEVLHMLRCLSM